ncbi:hypothetical protein ACR9E3_02840 [Actinomycetospora sp. C-140]
MTVQHAVVPREAAPAAADTPSPVDRGQHGLDRVGDVLVRGMRRGADVVGGVRSRLPRPVPIYLGLGALAVTGVLSWPVAVAAGCGYAAFRHWEPRPSGMPRP